MKTSLKGWLFALLSLFAMPTEAAPAVVNAPAEVHSANPKFCRSLQLTLQTDETGKAEDKGFMLARFLLESDKDYKSYSLTDSEGSAIPKEHGQVEISHVRNWAFVVDVSDPKARAATIAHEIGTVSTYLCCLPKEANVAVYGLARDLRMIARDHHNGWESAQNQNVAQVQIGGDDSSGVEASLKKGLAADSSASRYNTNLWVGVRTACEELANQQAGNYSAAPRCLVVLSDGVDESSTSSRDLQELCEYARSKGVLIYTISYPHKDGGVSRTEMQKGYAGLQALANETGGYYTNYEIIKQGRNIRVSDTTLQGMETLRRKMVHDLRVVTLRVDVRELPLQGNITLSLNDSDDEANKETVTVGGEYVGQVLGYFGLRILSEAVTGEKKEVTNEILDYVGGVFRICVYDQQRRKEILEYKELNKQLAARLRQLCQHLDNHTELLQEEREVLHAKIGLYLMDASAPLPQPKKELPPVLPPNKTSGLPSQQHSSVLQDWVWMALAFCVGVLILLGCVLLVRRSLNSEDNEDAENPGVVLTNVENPAESWSCEQTQIRIGRRSGNDIVLPYSSISGTQCFLNYTPAGVWELRDANSTNGTEVNGKRITGTYPLADGDIIGMAEVKLRFTQQ